LFLDCRMIFYPIVDITLLDANRLCSTLFQGDSAVRDIESMKYMYTMKDRQIRAALNEHWAASAARHLENEHDIYADNVVVDYPQSRERISGRLNVQALREHHPSKPAGFIVRISISSTSLCRMWFEKSCFLMVQNHSYSY
jgi:hypothetical protein